MTIQRISDSEFAYYLRLNPKVVEARFRFFLTLVLSLGVITMFYKPEALPLHFLIGFITIIAAILGFLVSIHKFKHIKSVGILIIWILYIRSAALIVKMLIGDNQNLLGTCVGALVWFMLGSLFIVNWVLLIEPYYEFTKKLERLKNQPTAYATLKKGGEEKVEVSK